MKITAENDIIYKYCVEETDRGRYILSTENKRGNSEYIRMTASPIFPLVGRLALPTVTTQIITSIYNMADTYFVSKLSESASGAVGIVYAMQSIIQAVGFGLAIGASSLISTHLGKKDPESANKYASSAFFAAVLCGFLLMGIFFIDLPGALRFFGSTETILPYAKSYATIIIIGAPIMCSTFVLSNALRSEGHATYSMVAMISGGILNIIFDPIFIFTFKMDIAGAALATVISQCVSFLVLLIFFLSKKSIVEISAKNISRRFKDYIHIFSTGIPTIFRQGMGSVATTLLNIAVKPYGDAAIAAVSTANKVYMLLRNLTIGVGQGFQPIAGYNYGAGKYKRVKKAFWAATLIGTVISCLCALVIGIFPTQVMAFFRPNDAEFIKIGTTMLICMSLSLPMLAYSTFVNQLYQGLGFVYGATFLASCRQGIFFVPIILTLPRFFNIFGIQAAQASADILTCLTSIPFHIYFMRHMLSDERQRRDHPKDADEVNSEV